MWVCLNSANIDGSDKVNEYQISYSSIFPQSLLTRISILLLVYYRAYLNELYVDKFIITRYRNTKSSVPPAISSSLHRVWVVRK